MTVRRIARGREVRNALGATVIGRVGAGYRSPRECLAAGGKARHHLPAFSHTPRVDLKQSHRRSPPELVVQIHPQRQYSILQCFEGVARSGVPAD